MIADEIKKQIRKIAVPLKSEEDLKVVLKARLTKREYKVLLAWSQAVKESELHESLGMSKIDYDKVANRLVKKLNQEKLKQELTE